MKRIDQLIELLENDIHQDDEFDAFIDLFRKTNGKISMTIRNLVILRDQFPEDITIVRSPNDHLELHINREALIYDGLELKVLQNFERCLRGVSPRLIVLQTTHSCSNTVKIYGFKDPVNVFGSDRTLVTKKERKLRKKAKVDAKAAVIRQGD